MVGYLVLVSRIVRHVVRCVQDWRWRRRRNYVFVVVRSGVVPSKRCTRYSNVTRGAERCSTIREWEEKFRLRTYKKFVVELLVRIL